MNLSRIAKHVKIFTARPLFQLDLVEWGMFACMHIYCSGQGKLADRMTCVQGLAMNSIPILPNLLQWDGPANEENDAAPLTSDSEFGGLCEGLNPEQREVVQRVVPWFQRGLQVGLHASFHKVP